MLARKKSMQFMNKGWEDNKKQDNNKRDKIKKRKKDRI